MLGSPKEINVNEAIILQSVDPRSKFCSTSLCLTEGATYRFTASGKLKVSFIVSGPDGWWCPILEQFNRVPRHRMFLLCGCVGRSLKTAFPIGSTLVWPALPMRLSDTDTQIYLFANDWECSYANNRETSRLGGRCK